jgi:hypothetical protein
LKHVGRGSLGTEILFSSANTQRRPNLKGAVILGVLCVRGSLRVEDIVIVTRDVSNDVGHTITGGWMTRAPIRKQADSLESRDPLSIAGVWLELKSVDGGGAFGESSHCPEVSPWPIRSARPSRFIS